ncbi:hypothetical protein QBC46DRAFT_409430 [Diplogelasinospora grovesii]|uniref:Transmembrane protein n=1 Tax=Diplogelasinospora grovesii TaxID=303347 RepID=A0AAN6S452_9PEZI|nr:hypothetical protein QBC46DRAFT_409430 [Diplogelasinospora grovesii]
MGHQPDVEQTSHHHDEAALSQQNNLSGGSAAAEPCPCANNAKMSKGLFHTLLAFWVVVSLGFLALFAVWCGVTLHPGDDSTVSGSPSAPIPPVTYTGTATVTATRTVMDADRSPHTGTATATATATAVTADIKGIHPDWKNAAHPLAQNSARWAAWEKARAAASAAATAVVTSAPEPKTAVIEARDVNVEAEALLPPDQRPGWIVGLPKTKINKEGGKHKKEKGIDLGFNYPGPLWELKMGFTTMLYENAKHQEWKNEKSRHQGPKRDLDAVITPATINPSDYPPFKTGPIPMPTHTLGADGQRHYSLMAVPRAVATAVQEEDVPAVTVTQAPAHTVALSHVDTARESNVDHVERNTPVPEPHPGMERVVVADAAEEAARRPHAGFSEPDLGKPTTRQYTRGRYPVPSVPTTTTFATIKKRDVQTPEPPAQTASPADHIPKRENDDSGPTFSHWAPKVFTVDFVHSPKDAETTGAMSAPTFNPTPTFSHWAPKVYTVDFVHSPKDAKTTAAMSTPTFNPTPTFSHWAPKVFTVDFVHSPKDAKTTAAMSAPTFNPHAGASKVVTTDDAKPTGTFKTLVTRVG